MRLLGRGTAQEYAAELALTVGNRPKILAIAGEGDTVVVGTGTFFAHRHEGTWQIIGYHEVANGGWKSSQATMWWDDTNGVHHEIQLKEPRLFMELFAERVTATILVDQVITEGDVKVRIVARRDLSNPGAVPVWSATVLDSTELEDSELARIVTDWTSRLEIDYGIGRGSVTVL